MRTDRQFLAAGWTRPTVRLDPDGTLALALLRRRSGDTVNSIVRRALLALAAREKSVPPKKAMRKT